MCGFDPVFIGCDDHCHYQLTAVEAQGHFAVGDARIHELIAVGDEAEAFVKRQGVKLGAERHLAVAEALGGGYCGVHQPAAYTGPAGVGKHRHAANMAIGK